jgi:hypothetical protein
MKNLRGQARVSAFLRKSLAEGAQDVLKLEAMARREALLGERQRPCEYGQNVCCKEI